MKTKQLNKELVAIILDRIKDEYNAFIFYRNLANYCYNVGFDKAGNYFGNESKCELKHSKHLQHFLNDNGYSFAIPLPDESNEPDNLVKCIESAYKLEDDLLDSYNENCITAFAIDMRVYNLFNKYVKIQEKAVKEYKYILDSLDLIDSSNKSHLFQWERKVF